MTEDADKRQQFETEALVHMDALYGLALRLTGGDAARSEDLVQDSLLKAFRAWDDFRLGTNCRAWLMTILRNTFINEFRSAQRRPTSVEYDEVADRSVFAEVSSVDPEGNFFERLIDKEVIAAVDALPDDFRIPIVLSDLEGLSYQEISEIMEIPVGTVKSRLFRARKRLQRKLYEYAVEMGYLS
ncbi:MAG: sigma-70 family RNA polymerase sigma factor [Gemmatimonadetes bacterium]|nr:sigma-70 family RNA polymerase sigma factor [Gemmatimonadota bacterium]